MDQVVLSLATLDDGKLEEEFREAYRAIANQLKHGEAGTITITVKMQRIKDTSAMMHVAYTLAAKPPAKAKAVAAYMGTDGTLKVDKLPEVKGKVAQLSLADRGGINE